MRFIPTPDERVEHLKKQAKKLQRKGGGKHAELLNRVAKSAGYDHWHHVVLCNKQGAASTRGLAALKAECEAIAASEIRGEARAVMTGPEIEVGPFVLFSTGIGDAWLIEPEEQAAMCLVWKGTCMEPLIKDDPSRLEITWHGHYELLGEFFHVDTGVPKIGQKAIAGYPMDAVRKLVQRAQSFEAKAAELFGQFDAVDLTDDVVARLVRQGWDKARLLDARAQGLRYSPSRDSILGPMMSSDDEDFEDSEFEDERVRE